MALLSLILSAALLLTSPPTTPGPRPQRSAEVVAAAQKLIRQQRYADAVNRLEQFLETSPEDAEALTYLAAAHLYADREYLKAQEMFVHAFRAGGGASFFVAHSHESMMSGEDLTNYCRGWLHLRRDRLEFAPDEGLHGFSVRYADVVEFKQNRHKKFFHVKLGGANQNFRPRTGEELETLLILALYKRFSR
jgi:tetratricopeptide (TPR) repeat protein